METIPSKLISSRPDNQVQAFDSNNALHRYLRSEKHEFHFQKHVFPPSSFLVIHAPFTKFDQNIIPSSIIDKLTERFGFRGFHYVTAKLRFSRDGDGEIHDLCFDSGCIINLIDGNFLRRCIPDVKCFKIPTKMTTKNVGNQKHDVIEYVIFQIFIPGQNTKTDFINREIHIMDGFSIKTLYGIDIMKPENITIDFVTDIMSISVCGSFRIPIIAMTKGFRTNATVYCVK